MKTDIVIIGAGGFGREVKCLIDSINDSSKEKIYSIVGFIDDGIPIGSKIHGIEVLGGMDCLNDLPNNTKFVLAIGNPRTKKNIYHHLDPNSLVSLIHPNVKVNTTISVGKGSIICEGTVITCDIDIAECVTINLNCTVGHDSTIGKFTSIMPGTNISGEVELAEGVYVGTGATIINQVAVGEYTIVGAGAVVTKDLPPNCTAVGAPAKPIKFH